MATPLQEFRFYKGDTFLADGLYRTMTGDPVNLTTAGVTIEAWVRGKDGRRYPLEVVFNDPAAGKYQIRSNDTSQWPLGRNQLIIRYTQNDIKRTATPVTIQVEGV